MARSVDFILRLVNRVSPGAQQISKDLSDVTKAAAAIAPVAKIAGLALGAIASAQIVSGLRRSVQEFSKTESALRRLETVAKSSSLAIDDRLNQALQRAQQFSVKHRQSTNELVNAMFELGTAGLTVEEAMAGAEQSAFLANAVMLDLTTSARLVGTIFNTLGRTTSLSLLGPFQKAERITRSLSQSIQLFAVTGPQLAEGLKFAIGSASLLGIEIEQLTVAIGLLNTAGLKGTVAGTALNQAFIQLDKAIRKLDLDSNAFLDAEGKLSKVSALISEVQKKVSNLAPFERFNAIIKAFGVRGARAVAALLPFANEIDGLAVKIRKNENAAKKLSDIFEKSLETDLIRLKNQLSITGQEIGEQLAPAVSVAVTVLAKASRGVAVFAEALGPIGTTVGAITVATAGLGLALAALTQAFALANSKAIAFTAVLRGIAPAAGVIGLITAGVATLIFALGNLESGAERVAKITKDINDINFSSLSDQVARLTGAFDQIGDSAKSAALSISEIDNLISDISDSGSTATGRLANEIASQANKLNINANQARDASKQAQRLAFADTGLIAEGITPEIFDKNVSRLEGNISIISSAFDKLRALRADAVKQGLTTEFGAFGGARPGELFAEPRGGDNKAVDFFAKNFSKQFLGSLTQALNETNLEKLFENEVLAKAFPKLAKGAGDIDSALRQFKNDFIFNIEGIADGNDLFEGEMVKLIKILSLPENVMGANFDSFNDASRELIDIVKEAQATIKKFQPIALIDQQILNLEARLNESSKRFNVAFEKATKLGASAQDISGGVTEGQRILSDENRSIDALISKLKKIETLIAGSDETKNAQALRTQRKVAGDLVVLINNREKALEKVVKLQEVLSILSKGERRVTGGPIQEALAESVKKGLLQGADAAKTDFANRISGLIVESVATSVSKALLKAGGLTQALKQLENPISALLSNDVTASSKMKFADEVKRIFSQADIRLDNAGAISKNFEFIISLIEQAVPGLDKISDRFGALGGTIGGVKKQILDLQEAFVSTTNVRDRAFASESQTLLQNRNGLSNVDLSRAIESRIQGALRAGIGSGSLPALKQAFRELQGNDLSSPINKAASGTQKIAEALNASVTPANAMKEAVVSVSDAAERLPAAFDGALSKVNQIVDKLSTLKTNLRVTDSSSSENDIDINFGNFNVSIEGGGTGDITEVLDEIEPLLRKEFDEKLRELAFQLREVENQRGR